MTPADERRLTQILDYVERALEYAAADRAAFDEDRRTQDAVIRCLTVIGEAAGALTDETYAQLPSLPPRRPNDQRNLLVHQYWKIDLEIVWVTVTADLPAVGSDIRGLINAS